jgi:hypothetical protein
MCAVNSAAVFFKFPCTFSWPNDLKTAVQISRIGNSCVVLESGSATLWVSKRSFGGTSLLMLLLASIGSTDAPHLMALGRHEAAFFEAIS